MNRHRWLSLALLAYTLCPTLAAPPAAAPAGGPLTVRPRSTEAHYAGAEVDVKFYLGDTRRNDPVLGPAPVPRATVKARVTMPSMPGMGAILPAIHEEGQPGYYGMVLSFPHEGDYLATLSVTTLSGEEATLRLPLKVLDAQPGQRREKPYRLELSTTPA